MRRAVGSSPIRSADPPPTNQPRLERRCEKVGSMTVMPSPEGIIRAFGGASFTTPVNIELAMALNAHAWADLNRPLSRRTDHEGDWPDSCAAIEHEGRARVGQESG